jgi:hypothetical protein
MSKSASKGAKEAIKFASSKKGNNKTHYKIQVIGPNERETVKTPGFPPHRGMQSNSYLHA